MHTQVRYSYPIGKWWWRASTQVFFHLLLFFFFYFLGGFVCVGLAKVCSSLFFSFLPIKLSVLEMCHHHRHQDCVSGSSLRTPSSKFRWCMMDLACTSLFWVIILPNKNVAVSTSCKALPVGICQGFTLNDSWILDIWSQLEVQTWRNFSGLLPW